MTLTMLLMTLTNNDDDSGVDDRDDGDDSGVGDNQPLCPQLLFLIV